MAKIWPALSTTSMSAAHGGAAAGEDHVFTCLTCSVAFYTPAEQRDHFRTDLHRYNMKRRVANLAPVSAAVFNEKVQERRAALDAGAKEPETSGRCAVCSKSFASDNAYRDHMQSKKHKENAAKAAKRPAKTEEAPRKDALNVSELREALDEDAEDDEDDEEGLDDDARMERAIQKKLARARRIDPAAECMFCSQAQASLEQSLEHMKSAHGFFLPEQKYLVDAKGLLGYLADKVSVGNVCLWCNGRGRGFHDLGAVQKHMMDKSHCKVAYDSQEDQLELADFYDFRASYPDYQKKQQEAEWEDVSDEDATDDENAEWQDDDGESDDELPPESGIRYGDSDLELVLPSGARLGHRSLQRYYRQSLWQTPASQSRAATATHGRALAHRLAGSDRLVRGDLVVGDRGGNEVVARNRGEAKEAQRHVREFRDMQRREQFKTRVGFRHNHQKHYRDALLQ